METFNQIIEVHSSILYKIGRSFTRTTADFDDLYQEMLINIYESLKSFREEAKLSTWIYRVALNTALTYYRSEKKKSNEIPLGGLKDFKEEAQYSDIQLVERKIQLLYRCINELKKEDRALILLHLEGKAYEEIAEILGISKSNTGVKLLRIKKQLQSLLIRYGYERS